MEFKVRHLEMIQSIIQKMSNNSFLLKGWTVSLIVAIITLADKSMNQMEFGLIYTPVIFFWFLDSYYLQLERKYTALYYDACHKESVEFNLSIEDINYKKTKKERLKYIRCLFSVSEWLFYVPIAILLTIIYKDNIISICESLFIK